MNINVQRLTAAEKEAVLLVADDLRLTLTFGDEDGVVLSAERREERGFVLAAERGMCLIYYGILPEFLRALAVFAAGGGKEMRVSQKPAADKLSFMADNSRNAVLKPSTVKKLMRKLALFGYTGLELYTEDTYEVKNQPYFGHMRGRFTAEEIKDLDAYAQKLGMELIPCIQTLAHLNSIFHWQPYQCIHDNTDILLADDDNTYKLIEDMVASVAENFSCRTLNIGMDEAMLIGAGAYFNKHGYVSRYEILIKHLRRVREICAKHGFRIKMWSDMFFRHWFEGKYYAIEEPMPKIKKGEIPEDIELIYWDYYHTESKEYKAMADKHAAIGCRTGFAGGAWKWSGFAPVNYFSLRAVRAAIPAIAGRVDDLMLTAWGDNGAECSVFAVMPVAAVYAEGAYGGAVDEGKEPRELFRAVMGLSFDDFVKLDCANRLGENWGEEPTSCSKYYLYNDPLMGIFDSFLIEGTAEQFAENAALLSAIADKAGEWAYLFRNLAGLCELLTIKADLGQRLKDAYDAKDLPRLKALADKDIADCLILLDTFVAGFETHWMTENKPFGFEVQHYRLGGLNSRLLYVQKVVREFVAGKRTEIPELKEARLDFMGKARTFSKEKQINFNYFAYTVSPGTL